MSIAPDVSHGFDEKAQRAADIIASHTLKAVADGIDAVEMQDEPMVSIPILELGGGAMRADPYLDARVIGSLIKHSGAFSVAYNELELAEPVTSIDKNDRLVSQRQADFTYAGVTLRLNERVVAEETSLGKRVRGFSLSLLYAKDPAKPFNLMPVTDTTFAHRPDKRTEDGTRFKDFSRAWEDFSQVFEPGETEYEASVPVLDVDSKQGELAENRPSIMFYDSQQTKQLPVTLKIGLQNKDEPITVVIEARDELIGYPISKNSDFGQPADIGGIPQFTSLKMVLLPNRQPILLGKRKDGSVIHLKAGEGAKAFGYSGFYDFLSPILLRSKGKLRHTKTGIHRDFAGNEKEVPPLSTDPEA